MLEDLLDFKNIGNSQDDLPEENPSAGAVGGCGWLFERGNRAIRIVNCGRVS
jgi:hypothetical protein